MLYPAPKNPSVDFLGIGDLQGKSPRCKAAIHGSMIIGKEEKKKLFSWGNKREYLKKIICKNRGS